MGNWRCILTAALCLVTGGASADVVTDWNRVYLDTIRATGGPPCPITRAGAMMHVAIYEAINSVDRTHEPYRTFLAAPPYASREAAAAQAAHDVLVRLYPARRALYDAALATSLSRVPPGAARAAGIGLGRLSAATILADRADDGTQPEPFYPLGGVPGQWQPTWPDYTAVPSNPGWGASTPWTMISGDQFRPRGPLHARDVTGLLRSRGYAEQVNEVRLLGARRSPVRTAGQTATAFFWANDVDGTYKPPGQLNAISLAVSAQRRLTLSENARMFALINLAVADAGLVAWDAKYRMDIDLWRPVTAIRLAGEDGNRHTEADPAWEPLGPFTPAFPSYVSGHATFAAAHAVVMADLFGDETTFTVGTDDPNYVGPPRTYRRFSDAARENALSRLYLGVHFRFDVVDGAIAGAALGRFVAAEMLRPLRRGDFNCDRSVDARDLAAFDAARRAGEWRADVNHDGRADGDDRRTFEGWHAAER